jgi:predicted HD superfamily hydrolase involved in NAD metabolism
MTGAAALEAKARRELSPARVEHVARVAAWAEAIAARWGVPAEPIRIAAWAHDLWKERADDELLAEARRLGLPVFPAEEAAPFILHGRVAAAHLAQAGADPRAVEAVEVHVTGRPGMGPVAEVLYVADKTEPGRRFEGVEALRQAVADGPAAAVFAVLRSEILFLVERRRLLHPWMVEAYQSYRRVVA